MNKITTVLIDDKVSNIKLLTHILNYNCPGIDILGSATNIEDGEKLINSLKPDVVFLDIILDTATGFDLLDKLTDKSFKLIFISAHSDYAIKAFKYNAYDYILKPLSKFDVIRVAKKIQEDFNIINLVNNETKNLNNYFDIALNQQNSIAVPSVDKIDLLKLENILFLKSEGRYTTFYLNNNEQILSSKNIGEYENLLNNNFFRIHNSYIINLAFVKSINKKDGVYCELIDFDSKIPVSKRRQDAFFTFLRCKSPAKSGLILTTNLNNKKVS